MKWWKLFFQVNGTSKQVGIAIQIPDKIIWKLKLIRGDKKWEPSSKKEKS